MQDPRSSNVPYLFTCLHCPKKYTTPYSLERHVKVVHETSLEYSCEICNKQFAIKQYLKEHLTTHLDYKPYVCGFPGCPKRYTQSGKLSHHRKTKHKADYPFGNPRATRKIKNDSNQIMQALVRSENNNFGKEGGGPFISSVGDRL